MRRLGVLGPVLVLLLVGCSVEHGLGQRGYRVTYTVESTSPNYLGPVEVDYVEGRQSVHLQTPRPIKAWAVDTWVSELSSANLTARLPDSAVEQPSGLALPPPAFPLHCRITVDGVEVRDEQRDTRCFARFDLVGYGGEAIERVPSTTHPPQLWPEPPPTTDPPAPTAPAGPRPETCRYATDAEIVDLVSRSGAGTLLFAGVTTSYPFSCLYRFAPLPTGGVPASPLTGVTVIRYPARYAAGDLRGDPVPGLPGAKRASDQEISANLPGGALTVQADLGSTFADRNASEEVFRLVRPRA